MVKSEFINALKNTNLIKREDLDELQKVIHEYPISKQQKYYILNH